MDDCKPLAGGRTPLHEAAARCRLEMVVRLLAAGASPARVDDMGRNALHHAALAGVAAPGALELMAALLAALPPPAPPTHFAPSKRLPTPPWWGSAR